MKDLRRRRLAQLNVKEYCLFRVICCELEDLQLEIRSKGGVDFPELATAMQDRRMLIEWLRDLRFPPASTHGESGINETVEDLLLMEDS